MNNVGKNLFKTAIEMIEAAMENPQLREKIGFDKMLETKNAKITDLSLITRVDIHFDNEGKPSIGGGEYNYWEMNKDQINQLKEIFEVTQTGELRLKKS